MKFLLPSACIIVFAAGLTGCQSNNVSVGGIPKWLASGAKIEEEPAAYKPDPAIIEYERKTGPIEVEVVTDRREYSEPKPETKKKASSERDPIERGREYRIRRLFH